MSSNTIQFQSLFLTCMYITIIHNHQFLTICKHIIQKLIIVSDFLKRVYQKNSDTFIFSFFQEYQIGIVLNYIPLQRVFLNTVNFTPCHLHTYMLQTISLISIMMHAWRGLHLMHCGKENDEICDLPTMHHSEDQRYGLLFYVKILCALR